MKTHCEHMQRKKLSHACTFNTAPGLSATKTMARNLFFYSYMNTTGMFSLSRGANSSVFRLRHTTAGWIFVSLFILFFFFLPSIVISPRVISTKALLTFKCKQADFPTGSVMCQSLGVGLCSTVEPTDRRTRDSSVTNRCIYANLDSLHITSARKPSGFLFSVLLSERSYAYGSLVDPSSSARPRQTPETQRINRSNFTPAIRIQNLVLRYKLILTSPQAKNLYWSHVYSFCQGY